MLIVIRGPHTVAATARLGLLVCVAMISILLGIWSTGVDAEPQGFVVLPGGAPGFSGPVGGEANTAEILATREQTGGAFGVWRYTSPAGGGPPVHLHRAEDEFFYVLNGEFNFQLGDCIKSAPAGSFVFIPKGAVHTFQHVGPEPGALMGAVTPGGFEGLFMDLPGADEDAVRAFLKKHHMDVVGPPLDANALARKPAPPGTPQPRTKLPRIGVLVPACAPFSPVLEVFLQGLRARGYVEVRPLPSSGAMPRDGLSASLRSRPSWSGSQST